MRIVRWPLIVIFLCLLGPPLTAGPGDWERVGPAGAWKGVLAGTHHAGKFYAAEANGNLYETDPKTGGWKQIGKTEFGNTRLMFSAGDSIYSIEADGSLYRISPADGSWSQVGNATDWKGTIAGTTLGGKLYTVETDGNLYQTDPKTGGWKQIGKTEFGNTRGLFAADKMLYSIETDGSMYSISPVDGSWSQVGKAGDWKGVKAGAVVQGKLYGVERDGNLYETDPKTGGWKQIGKSEFGNTRLMFGVAGQLYSIERDGSLYRIATK